MNILDCIFLTYIQFVKELKNLSDYKYILIYFLIIYLKMSLYTDIFYIKCRYFILKIYTYFPLFFQ